MGPEAEPVEFFSTIIQYWKKYFDTAMSFAIYNFVLLATAIDDHFDVTNYLLNLGTTHIYDLGLTLGLNQPHVRNMMDSQTFRDDTVAAWLQREDNVVIRRGVPTWRTLVRALRDRRVNQIGVAGKIAADKNVAE